VASLRDADHADPYPREFRENVVAVARQGEEGNARIARDFGIAKSCLRNWLNAADADDGQAGRSKGPGAEQLREVERRNRLLEQEIDVLAPRRGVSVAGLQPKMVFQLIRDLAVPTALPSGEMLSSVDASFSGSG